MQHLFNVNEYNKRHMAFISSNTSAGSQGKELQKAGPTPPLMSQQEYLRTMTNAFNDPDIAFKKLQRQKGKKRKEKAASIFLKKKV